MNNLLSVTLHSIWYNFGFSSEVQETEAIF